MGQFLCPVILPLHRVAAKEPRVCLEAWLQDLHVAHRTHKPERCSSSSGRKLPCFFKSHPPGLLFAFCLPWLTTIPHSPPLTAVPNLLLDFYLSIFHFKANWRPCKAVFLSKMNLGTRGWTSHIFGERSAERFTLDSKEDFKREGRGREASPGGRRRGPYKRCFTLTLSKVRGSSLHSSSYLTPFK